MTIRQRVQPMTLGGRQTDWRTCFHIRRSVLLSNERLTPSTAETRDWEDKYARPGALQLQRESTEIWNLRSEVLSFSLQQITLLNGGDKKPSHVTPLLIYSVSFAYEYILELIDLHCVRVTVRWPVTGPTARYYYYYYYYIPVLSVVAYSFRSWIPYILYKVF